MWICACNTTYWPLKIIYRNNVRPRISGLAPSKFSCCSCHNYYDPFSNPDSPYCFSNLAFQTWWINRREAVIHMYSIQFSSVIFSAGSSLEFQSQIVNTGRTCWTTAFAPKPQGTFRSTALTSSPLFKTWKCLLRSKFALWILWLPRLQPVNSHYIPSFARALTPTPSDQWLWVSHANNL